MRSFAGSEVRRFLHRWQYLEGGAGAFCETRSERLAVRTFRSVFTGYDGAWLGSSDVRTQVFPLGSSQSYGNARCYYDSAADHTSGPGVGILQRQQSVDRRLFPHIS